MTIDLTSYLDELYIKSASMLAGKLEYFMSIEDEHLKQPILKLFLGDNDLQEITLCSSNIGFVRTYRKCFNNEPTKQWISYKKGELKRNESLRANAETSAEEIQEKRTKSGSYDIRKNT
jgi:hypothetical protein